MLSRQIRSDHTYILSTDQVAECVWKIKEAGIPKILAMRRCTFVRTTTPTETVTQAKKIEPSEDIVQGTGWDSYHPMGQAVLFFFLLVAEENVCECLPWPHKYQRNNVYWKALVRIWSQKQDFVHVLTLYSRVLQYHSS
jgi:hypothetical protein